jgi:hypothetical protein
MSGPLEGVTAIEVGVVLRLVERHEALIEGGGPERPARVGPA